MVQLALSERPKPKELESLKSDGCDLDVTFLALHGEQARRIGSEVISQCMEWEWANISHAQNFSNKDMNAYRRSLKRVHDALASGSAL